ncbi:MAG TPA: alpha/beta hydrolase-fold protein, partial [Planctomycetota bacterium]|nr:alpha/beta hydrolase-fold protein [Planctomycetota bacterium]
MTLPCVLLLVLAGCAAQAQPHKPVEPAAPPSLRPDPGRTTRASLGSEGLAYQIDSVILGETRTINVALPRSFEAAAADRRYPVAIVLDGEANLPATAAVAAELAFRGQIPELVLVAIENTDRLRDLTPPGLSVSGSSRDEGGDRFLDFIEQELLPAVDRQFRGAGPRVLIGHSSGGILATYVAATRPTWRVVVALDTPVHLGQNWLAGRLTEAAAAPPATAAVPRPPLRYVALEARFAWPDAAWDALVAAAPPTWTLHREQLARESHESMVMLGAYLGLREAFADYSMLAAPVAPTTSILPYYDAVAESLGAPIVPPRPLLSNVVDDLLMEGRGAAAHEAYDRLVAGYGA